MLVYCMWWIRIWLEIIINGNFKSVELISMLESQHLYIVFKEYRIGIKKLVWEQEGFRLKTSRLNLYKSSAKPHQHKKNRWWRYSWFCWIELPLNINLSHTFDTINQRRGIFIEGIPFCVLFVDVNNNDNCFICMVIT